MNIAIVGQYYWPENFLINDIAEELVKRGNKVTVLTGLPDYSTNYVPEEYKHGKNRHEVRNGVDIYRVPIIARRTGFVFRVFNYLSFFLTSSLFARTHKIEADVIMAYQTAPVLMGNAAIVLKKKLKKPLFYYCLDIWPDQMKVWNVNENNLLYKIIHKYCIYAYGKADLLGISSTPFKKYMIDVNKVDEEKIVYLPQHASRLDIENYNIKKNEINLMFAGNIGKQQNLECLLKAISKIHTDVKYKVHIFGNGTSFNKCKELAKMLNILDRVIFYGKVEKNIINENYKKMDALLLTLCSEKEIGYTAYTLPAKFQSYISSGKPILASIDGSAKDIIEETKCGLAVNASNIDGYANIIKKFVENPEKYSEFGTRGKDFFNNNYDKKIVMDRLEEYLEELNNNEK